MSLPIALRYRPQRFSDLVGNDFIRTILLNSIIKDKVRHAYFFSGTRGSGKTTTARIFAKAINCTNNQNGEPCNACPSCLSISQEKSIDVLEIDAASENSVQSIRDLTNSIQYAPAYSKRKVIILDESHMLTQAASNALLKTLEEPPAHVVFLFCTTDPQKVLETIKSRTMMFQFQRLQVSDISDRLKWVCLQEGFSFEEEALNLISFSVNGGMRDALTLLDQASLFDSSISINSVKNLVGFVSYSELLEFFVSIDDTQLSIEWIKEVLLKNSPSEVVNSILRFLENLIYVQTSVKTVSLSESLVSELKLLSSRISLSKLTEFMAICHKSLKLIKSIQVYDSSIFVLEMYLGFYKVLKGEAQVSQYNGSLVSLFLGETQKSFTDLAKEHFNFTEVRI